MLNILLATYLLIIGPSLNMWRSLYPKKDKPPRAQMLRYWSMSWPVLVMLGVLLIGSWQAGYTVRDIGFDMPLSNAGAWGLGFSALLLGGLFVAGSIIEHRYTAETRAKNERKLLDSPFPWPHTAAETAAFVVSMTLMTAGWEVLYRGFILLFLTSCVGLPIAVTVSAFAYGIGHGYQSAKQLTASIASAFVFTIAYASTNSLWWLIVIHAGLPLSVVPAALRAYRRNKIEILNTAI
ncbi:CPBP family intramembrane glutamic endopeptidase [Duganella violaceipulchra]|uniref:CPBP family intramembrane metalloprotease n=1 Tax=Duganella violaceipulchra TaxID=2849652 RepID=A0AA41KZ81_9BURK|nr:CPBP family intramembrane glutamic endopeptidase [Duganella violaceicalia]MBV6319841.1 CPBP family intramembrane metalloprotease [Duganella violaceicalia]MCP2006342.1 membrane protease YdiL (CAAX protease family) [Duganella violaceicalia]